MTGQITLIFQYSLQGAPPAAGARGCMLGRRGGAGGPACARRQDGAGAGGPAAGRPTYPP